MYDSDPKVNPDAKKFDSITLNQVLNDKLQVIDLSATLMCLENKMPMMIFGLNEEDSILKSLTGDFNGTYVNVD